MGIERPRFMIEDLLERMQTLARALGLAHRINHIQSTIESLTEPWTLRRVGDLRGWQSDVADDGSPYEPSFVLMRGRTELRVLLEAQAEAPTLATQWQAGLELTEQVGRRLGADLGRFELVHELFRPNGAGRLALWHALVFDGSGPASVKLYFDAQAQGRSRAPELIEAALGRLGLGEAFKGLLESPMARSPELDEPKYVSLDLSSSESARIKLYFCHHDVTREQLHVALGGAGPLCEPLASFLATLAPGESRFVRRPLFSCHAFTLADPAREPARAVYLPVESYVEDDAEIMRRASSYLQSRGLDAAAYEACVGALGPAGGAASPRNGRGKLHSYIGLRESGEGPRVMVYLSPNVLDGAARSPVAEPARTAEAIVDRFEREELLTDHPFFLRLASEDVDLGLLWLVMANFWHGVVADFPTRLAHMAAKVEDDRIRCIMAKQLHDELGRGDPARAHKPMFLRMLAALVPHRRVGSDEQSSAPGRALALALAEPIYSADPHESVGALMMLEIYGKQVDGFLAEQFRRQTEVTGESLEWLHLHESLEIDHADDARALARLVPAEVSAQAATWRGAERVARAGRDYFDRLARVCFP